ncbi:diacylglycerol kinase [Dethiothermospora halolimnae]|uniref:diacylglycerol kinase n=1 Tax=Dethiothermospora halolimnae TaxID=3114390 RepID=UPI003CCBEC35
MRDDFSMKIRRTLNSIKYAIKGISYGIKNQRNMQIHFFMGSLTLLISPFFNLSKLEILILVFTICIVMMAEMINTAIEKTVDMITKEYHPLAKISKDLAAGAVLITAINAIVVGYFLFIKNIILNYKTIIINMKNSLAYLGVIIIVLVSIIIFFIKNNNNDLL